MRILVGCEFSGIVRDAFLAKGHDAVSCDLLPSERPGPHIQGDVTKALRDSWDMVIAHPPCTYLSYVGNAHWNKPGREELRREAMAFFMACVNANTPKVCVENPFGLPCQEFRRPDQIINPYDFGEAVRKRTCLWLRGLPILFRADDLFAMHGPTPLPPPEPVYVGTRIESGKTKARHWADCAGSAKNRSRTFQSVANAMAEQWSKE